MKQKYKQVAILSGKGGTGKTSIVSAFAEITSSSKHRAVFVDSDVDAANLSLILGVQKTLQKQEFSAGTRAVIDVKKCIGCGNCVKVCHEDAISVNSAKEHLVNEIACDGCKTCSLVCPIEGAITFNENIAGEWFISQTDVGKIVHAELFAAQDNSGKLVSQVRKAGEEIAEKDDCDVVIIDGPPGIGCPVHASVTNIDLCIIVTEPTQSGYANAEMVIELSEHFKFPVMVIINKYDLSNETTLEIEKKLKEKGVQIIGKIPFDKKWSEQVASCKPIMKELDDSVKQILVSAWEKATSYFKLN